MQHTGYMYDVKATIKFTRADLDTLLRESNSHYDGVCKAAGKPGGFLFGFDNTPPGEDGTINVLATTHQLDTLCKILEMLPYRLQEDSPEVKKMEQDLKAGIRRALQSCNAEYVRLNHLERK